MPTLIWNSPSYDQMVHQTVVDLITDFNAKLLEVGLIDITSLNSTNISTIPNTAGATIWNIFVFGKAHNMLTSNSHFAFQHIRITKDSVANRYASQILATNSIIPPTRFV